jgi:hypothetical protein
VTILASSGTPEYKILSAFTAETLSSMVNQHLQDGWSIYGSLNIHGNNILQPMLRRAKAVELDGEVKTTKKKTKKTTEA